jgi:hypothetical protein
LSSGSPLDRDHLSIDERVQPGKQRYINAQQAQAYESQSHDQGCDCKPRPRIFRRRPSRRRLGWRSTGTDARCDGDIRCSLDCSSLEILQLRSDTKFKVLVSNTRKTIMAIQIVMDRTGDSRHTFNSHDAQELAEAEQRFYELTKVGFTATVRTGPGQVSRLQSFDPSAEEIVFFPRLVGG